MWQDIAVLLVCGALIPVALVLYWTDVAEARSKRDYERLFPAPTPGRGRTR